MSGVKNPEGCLGQWSVETLPTDTGEIYGKILLACPSCGHASSKFRAKEENLPEIVGGEFTALREKVHCRRLTKQPRNIH